MRRYIFAILALSFIAIFSKATDIMRFRRYTIADGMPQNSVTTITQDRKGYIWIGSRSGLCRFDGLTFKQFSETSDGQNIGWVHKIRIADDGETLILKIHGDKYYYFYPSSRTLKPVNGKIDLGVQEPPHTILDFDEKGMIVRKSPDSETYRIPVSSSIPYVAARCENFIDAQGNIWASFDNALYEVCFSSAPYSFHSYIGDYERHYFDSEVRCLKRLNDGKLIVATKNRLVICYSEKGKFLGYLTPDGKISERYTQFIESVYSIQQMPDSTLCLAMRVAGVALIKNLFKSNADISLIKTPHIASDCIYSTYLNGNNKYIWLGTWGKGVSVIDAGNPFRRIKSPLPGNLHVRDITSFSDTIAICTDNGLYLLPRHGESEPIHIGDMDIAGLAYIRGVKYVATTGNGIFRIDEQQGIPTLSRVNIPFVGYGVLSITALDNAQIAIVTPNRLVIYNLADRTARSMDDKYFGRSIEFTEAKPIVAPDSMTLGTVDGFISVHTIFSKSKDKPHIEITTTATTTGMGIPVTINAITLDHRLPHTIYYAWRVKGEDEWNYFESENAVLEFARFLPGSYDIEIRSTDAFGLWTDNTSSITITVIPSWWQTLIILLIVILLCFICILLWKLAHPKHIDTTDISPSKPDTTPFDRKLASMIVNAIENHIDDSEYDVEHLANDVGMSRSQLYSQCRSALQRTPASLILEIRLKRAMQLIATHSFRINEIAYKVGFTDPKYFAKVFKSKVGMTPSQYAETKSTEES